MRLRLKIRFRTLLLIVLAAAVSAQGLALFLSTKPDVHEPRHPDNPDFLLEVYGEPGGVEFLAGARPQLPLFDPTRGDWSFEDQPLSEFAGHVEGLEIGPHGSSPFVIVALLGEPSVGDYRKALASLARHGVCRVGVYAPMSHQKPVARKTGREPSGNTFVPVYRVLRVKPETGPDHECIDRFPAWAPWAVNRD